MLFSLEKIKQIINPLRTVFNEETTIDSVFIDSRINLDYTKALFVAIKGNRYDGHQFISTLIEKGVKNFIVSNKEIVAEYEGINFFLVENTLTALQSLAKAHKDFCKLNTLIAITGSNGKTVVKEWLYSILSAKCENVIKSPKSYNSQVGVPLSLLLTSPSDSIGIFEIGISKPKEMAILERIVSPNIGILTNLYQAHQENFESLEDKLKEKLILFSSCQSIIFPGDNELVNDTIRALFPNKKLYSWGENADNNLVIRLKKSWENQTAITFSFCDKEYTINCPFTDSASVDNVIICWLAAKLMELPTDFISKEISQLTAISMRLETQFTSDNNVVINDTYNADLFSLKIALDYMIEYSLGRKRVLFLSDIYQSGISSQEFFTQINKWIVYYAIDELYFVGARFDEFKGKFNCKEYFFTTTSVCLKHISLVKFSSTVFLVKGARLFSFHKIAQQLSHYSYVTSLELDRQGLLDNLSYYRQQLVNTSTEIIPMIKASAYGSGAVEIAKVLETQGYVKNFGVMYVDEGIELRKGGVKSNIIVFNPIFQNFQHLIKQNLEPVIFTIELLKDFVKGLKSNLFLKVTFPYPIHLKLETGMNRLGIDEKQLPEFINEFNKHKEWVSVVSVYSHLVASEDEKFDKFTHNQIEQFELMSALVEKEIGYKVKKHILNSSGITRFKAAQYDFVRLGIGLYGVLDGNPKLKAVHKLVSRIAQIKSVDNTQTVGYGRKGKLTYPSIIATVLIGYADGINRNLGRLNWNVFINGMLCPIVGDVCMDMIMIEVTNCKCKVGDEVEIFGPNNPLAQMAKKLNTIPYEVLTSISQRVKKVTLELR